LESFSCQSFNLKIFKQATKVSSNINKATFGQAVRSACKVYGERDPLRFTNFRRQLLVGNDNLFPISKTFSKVISKYYFSKKKTRFNTYKIYVTNITSSRGLDISTSTRFFKLGCKLDYLLTSKNTQRMLHFSLGNFN
jgi:hypothetical protein